MTSKLSRRALLASGSALALAACGKTDTPESAGTPAAPKEETGYVDVPGGKVWWTKSGEGERTPLLILHGGPGAAHNYLLPLKGLADERPVIFYDQLGCGRSDAPENDALYRIPRFVEELTTVRKALGLDKIMLYGHSWGTMLAIEYVVTTGAPGVEKLVLGGALASMPQFVAGTRRLLDALPNGVSARLKALEVAGQQSSKEYEDLAGLFYRAHVCRLDPWPKDFTDSLEILSKSPAYRIMNGPNEFTVIGNVKDWDRTADLNKIKVPLLLMTGQYDEVTLDCHQTIQAAVPGSELMIFGDCSHCAMLEKPEAYNKVLRTFLS